MALPSYPGGSSAKVADLYEAAWTADSLFDLIAGNETTSAVPTVAEAGVRAPRSHA